jgi:hypothetical protein
VARSSYTVRLVHQEMLLCASRGPLKYEGNTNSETLMLKIIISYVFAGVLMKQNDFPMSIS